MRECFAHIKIKIYTEKEIGWDVSAEEMALERERE
jgi:hypothetical protein